MTRSEIAFRQLGHLSILGWLAMVESVTGETGIIVCEIHGLRPLPSAAWGVGPGGNVIQRPGLGSTRKARLLAKIRKRRTSSPAQSLAILSQGV